MAKNLSHAVPNNQTIEPATMISQEEFHWSKYAPPVSRKKICFYGIWYTFSRVILQANFYEFSRNVSFVRGFKFFVHYFSRKLTDIRSRSVDDGPACLIRAVVLQTRRVARLQYHSDVVDVRTTVCCLTNRVESAL